MSTYQFLTLKLDMESAPAAGTVTEEISQRESPLTRLDIDVSGVSLPVFLRNVSQTIRARNACTCTRTETLQPER